MTKELTPLEALCNLTQIVYNYAGFDEELTKNINGYFETIETALKDGEKYKTIYLLTKAKLDKVSDVKLKLEGVIEIIKDNQVNIGYLLDCDNYEEYLDYFNDRTGEGNLPSFKLLTEEEFNLLKEVLKSYE